MDENRITFTTETRPRNCRCSFPYEKHDNVSGHHPRCPVHDRIMAEQELEIYFYGSRPATLKYRHGEKVHKSLLPAVITYFMEINMCVAVMSGRDGKKWIAVDDAGRLFKQR